MRNTLVTGGLGFIGGWLAETLLTQGDCVTVVDHAPLSSSRARLALPILMASSEATFFGGSLKDFVSSGGIDDRRFDRIYHLASPVGPVGVLKEAGNIALSLLEDVLALRTLAAHHTCPIVFCSSSEVYGGGNGGYCSETVPCHIALRPSPRQEYAVGKLAAEVTLLSLERTGEIDVRVVRPFNVTGPRQLPDGGFVLPRFVLQALLGLPLTVYGEGKAIRAFTHVADIVQGLLRAGEGDRSGRVYNLGNFRNKCRIQELAVQTLYLTHSASPIQHLDPKLIHGPLFEEAEDKFPDATRASRELGWKAEYDREMIVEEVIAYWRAQPVAELERMVPLLSVAQ